jgi:DNA-binding response OmpR family regulator
VVVDDNELVLQEARAVLEEAGYIVSVAQDLASFSVLLDLRRFDLLLLDEMMPEMLGHDLVPYLKLELKLAAPVVLFSEQDPVKIQNRARQCGADGVVSKDLYMNGLVDQVRRFLPQ